VKARTFCLIFLITACNGDARSAAVANAPSSALVGTWRAVDYINPHPEDSASRYPFGRPPHGYLVYDATGHVFLQVVRGLAAAPEARGRWANADSATLLRLLNGAAAYFGSYRADYGAGTVIHRIEGEIPPNVGTTEVATPFRVAGDTLRLGRDSAAHWTFVRVRSP
jgi:hypothetical protein